MPRSGLDDSTLSALCRQVKLRDLDVSDDEALTDASLAVIAATQRGLRALTLWRLPHVTEGTVQALRQALMPGTAVQRRAYERRRREACPYMCMSNGVGSLLLHALCAGCSGCSSVLVSVLLQLQRATHQTHPALAASNPPTHPRPATCSWSYRYTAGCRRRRARPSMPSMRTHAHSHAQHARGRVTHDHANSRSGNSAGATSVQQ